MEIMIECNGTINAHNLRAFFEDLCSKYSIDHIPLPHTLHRIEGQREEDMNHRNLARVRMIVHDFSRDIPGKVPGECSETGECGRDKTEKYRKEKDGESGKDKTEKYRKEAELIALDVFDILAEAEAAVHHSTPEDVHFHEVGEMKNIRDVCACARYAAALQNEVGDVVFQHHSPLQTGRGTIRCAHGDLPLPAPATRSILDRFGFMWEHGDVKMEQITPTGAALLAVLTGGK